MATHLLNILPTKTLSFSTPHFALFGVQPSYEHLRVFGCKCYPNLSATAAHKLAPRSSLCVFLGYSPHHKGYVCLDRHSNRTIISRHVVFDESSFPFAEGLSPPSPEAFDFLEKSSDPMQVPFSPSPHLSSGGTSSTSPPPAPGLPASGATPSSPQAAPPARGQPPYASQAAQQGGLPSPHGSWPVAQ